MSNRCGRIWKRGWSYWSCNRSIGHAEQRLCAGVDWGGAGGRAGAARKQERKERTEEAQERKPIPLLQRLDAESLYVPAPAGAGKSTFCRWAVLQSIAGADLTHVVPAPDNFAEPVPANLRGRLPLLVPLREFWRRMDCGRGEREWRRGDLERALAAWIDASPPDGLSGDLLLAHERGHRPPAARRTRPGRPHRYPRPRHRLSARLVAERPRRRFADVAQGRQPGAAHQPPHGLDDAGLHRLDLPAAVLELLPREERPDLFVARWFHTLGKAEKTKDLIATINDRDDLAPLAENPMLLTAICVLYDNGGRLPEDRYQLYKSIVEGVLHNRYSGDTKEREPVERRLEAVALGMHLGDTGQPRLTPAAEISWFEVERLLACFAKLSPEYETDQLEVALRREDLLNHSGLLVPRANQRAGFYHLSFQEFLAAQRLSRTADDVEKMFHAHLPVPEWRPTLLFLFAAQIANRDAGWGLRLLARLIGEQNRAVVKANPAPAFIAEALDLCLAKNYAVPEELKEAFRRLAQDAIEDEVELQARQALGLTLGRVGDPRIFDLRDEHGNVDPRAYVEVPAGTYPYGDKRRTVEIPASFRIGRYPVTNQQYVAFIGAKGYTERRWWSEGGWAWLEKEKVTEPRYWHARRWSAPNQPVVGVSFWRRRRCAWLAAGCRRKRSGKPPPAVRRASSIPGATSGRTASATRTRPGSASPRQWGCFLARAGRPSSPSTTGRQRPGMVQ